jgi:hypothetical protein
MSQRLLEHTTTGAGKSIAHLTIRNARLTPSPGLWIPSKANLFTAYTKMLIAALDLLSLHIIYLFGSATKSL